MFFKNLIVYRLPKNWPMTLEAFREQLGRAIFARCPSNQLSSRGWVAPRGDDHLVYVNNHQWLISLATEHRLLPASVINEATQERAEEIELQQGYAPGRKQMRELKERVIDELLPRAFTCKKTTFAWIDPINGWFVVDAGSQSKAEDMVEHLRYSLDEFPLLPLRTEISPVSAMAEWLAGEEAPAGFTVDRDCELKSTEEEKSAVAYKRHTLDGEAADQIKIHLAAGKLPTRLALTWDDRISFVLTEKFEIKRLEFLDLVKEDAGNSAESASEQFDADFAIMTGELLRFLPQMIEALGGEASES